jgi:predicted  nucleic acid-binding Zn-ribbon protein
MPVATLPADELAQLKQDLEVKQNDTSKLAKEIDNLKAQIADLSKTVGDIDQKTSAYEKASGAAGDQVKDLTAYVKTEKAMLKAAVSTSTVTDVEGKKSAALQKLADLKTKLADATKKAADADTAYRKAKDVTVAAQAAYKAIADLPGANADVIKDLTGLRTAADKQGAANSLGRQYFLVLVMEDRLGTIKALTPEEYKKQLNDAGSALAAASDAQTTAKDALDAAVAEQKQTQKDLDDERAKWRQETLDSIPATSPPAAAAPSP